MSNKKHTAVEWIEAYLKTYTSFNLYKIIEKAKEIEKEQIIDAWVYGDNSDCLSEQDSSDFAEQYYNETFKTK